MGPKSRELLQTPDRCRPVARDRLCLSRHLPRPLRLEPWRTVRSHPHELRRRAGVGALCARRVRHAASTQLIWSRPAGDPRASGDAGHFCARMPAAIGEGLSATGGTTSGPRIQPLEAGLGFAVAWDKPADFIGKQALLRQRQAGVTKRLAVFTLDDPEALPFHDEPLYRDDELAGYVTLGPFRTDAGPRRHLRLCQQSRGRDGRIRDVGHLRARHRRHPLRLHTPPGPALRSQGGAAQGVSVMREQRCRMNGEKRSRRGAVGFRRRRIEPESKSEVRGRPEGESVLRGFAAPGLLPSVELCGPDLVARVIPFMQAEKLVLGDLPEPPALGGLDVLVHP